MKVIDYEQLIAELREHQTKGILSVDELSFAVSRVYQWHDLPIAERRPFWVFREQQRLLARIYAPLPSLSTRTKEIFHSIPENLFAHQPTKTATPAMIAFTKDADSGERDIQMISRIGKFLRKYGSGLTEQEINDTANEYTQIRESSQDNPSTGLFFLTNPTDIVDAYKNCATSSCMSYNENKWELQLHPEQHPDINTEVIEDLKGATVNSGERQLIHPAALYGHMENIKLAIYKVRERILSRVLVNTAAMTFTRLYGNSHILELLKEQGYTQGELYPTKLPLIKVIRPGYSETPHILAPYLDGSTAAVIPRVEIYADKSHAAVTKGDGVPFRAWQEAAINFTNVCPDCSKVVTNNHDLMAFRGLDDNSATYVCIRCHVKRSHLLIKGIRLGFHLNQYGDLKIKAGRKNDFVPFTGELPIDIRSRSALRQYPSADSAVIINNIAASSTNDKVLTAHYHFIKSHIHKSLIPHLRIDSISGKLQLPECMKSITLPNGSVGETTTPIMEIYDTELVWSKQLFDQGHYKTDRELIALPPIITRADYCVYAHRDTCVNALTTATTTYPIPRKLATFATKTGKWFYDARNMRAGFFTETVTQEALNAAIKKHGVEIMWAGKIVDNFYPRALYRTPVDTFLVSDWVDWHEEIHNSTCLTQIKSLLLTTEHTTDVTVAQEKI